MLITLLLFQTIVIIYLTYTALRLQNRFGWTCKILGIKPDCSYNDLKLDLLCAAASRRKHF